MMIQTDDPNLVRDTNNRALFPKRSALEEFRKNKKKEQRVADLEDRVESIEKKLDTLIELLGGKS